MHLHPRQHCRKAKSHEESEGEKLATSLFRMVACSAGGRGIGSQLRKIGSPWVFQLLLFGERHIFCLSAIDVAESKEGMRHSTF